MLNQNFKSFAGGWVCLLLLAACDSGSRFTHNEPIEVTVGKPVTTSVNVKHWSGRDQLVLLPGGPYVADHFPLTRPVKFIYAVGEQVVAVDNNNHLDVLDFSAHPARRMTQLDLTDEAAAIILYGKFLVVAFKQEGLVLYDLSDLPAIKKAAQYNAATAITRLKVFDNKVFTLVNDRQLVVLEISTAADSHMEWRHVSTINLPAPSIDFEILGNYAITIGPAYGIGSLLLTAPQQFLATASLQNKPKKLQVAENTAYVADGEAGLVLFDARNPEQLQWLGSHNKFDTVDDVYVSGKRAYVVDRGMRLATLNISNRTLPVTGSFYKPAGPISGFAAAGDEVYIATGLRIERVRFPAPPHMQISNEGINQGGSRRAFIKNNIAYVADWFSGLHLYDISNPAHPRHISNYHTPGSSKGVVVDGDYAYVGDDDHGLQIIDVSNPELPVKVSEIMTTGLAYTLQKRENLIYLADHRGGFHIIDVSDVRRPQLVSSYDTPGKSWAIDVADNIAYVADDTSGLLIFDVSNAKRPRQIGQFNPQGAAEDVVVKDKLAYISFFDKGLHIVDIGNPYNPLIVARLPIPGNARSIMIEGKHAYIAGWESGLNIVDISNPKAPRIVGRYDTKGSAWGANISNGYAYVWDWWGGVVALNVTDPLQPQLAGKYHAREPIITLRQKGDYIYTASGGGVQVFDINNALNPIWVTGIDFPGPVADIWPAAGDGFAFVANAGEGLRVLDISDPFYIRSAGRYNTGGNTRLVREHNNRVYAANEASGLVIYNAGNPRQLVKQRELPLTVKDMWLHENRLLIVNDNKTLLAFEINDSGQPAEHYDAIDDNTERVIANPSLIVTSTSDNKIKIWRINQDSYDRVSVIEFDEPILDMQLAEQRLWIGTLNQGLFSYDISDPAHPVIQTRYPATDITGRVTVSGEAVFFGGAHTIASVQRLAPLAWKSVSNTQLEVTVPANLDSGRYHLQIGGTQGYEQLWPNAITVSLPQSKKPKMTMDDFKKLLEKHRSQQ